MKKDLSQKEIEKHQAFLTLGCNVDKEKHIPFVIEALQGRSCSLRQTPLMTTTPIDFPYPSDDFANIGFLIETTLELNAFKAFLKGLEEVCGRTKANSELRPELVPMDLDLIAWDGELIKPKDLQRPYVQDCLAYFALSFN